MSGQIINFGTFFSSYKEFFLRLLRIFNRQQELFQPFLLWWMAVLLFGAKPVTGSTSRKWDTTCLALLPRMYSLASLSPRWDSCQIQSIASERSWRDVCSKSEYFFYRGRDCHHFTVFFFFFFSSPAWTRVSSIALYLPGFTTTRLPCFLDTREHSSCQFMKVSLLSSHFLNNMTLGLREIRIHMAPL